MRWHSHECGNSQTQGLGATRVFNHILQIPQKEMQTRSCRSKLYVRIKTYNRVLVLDQG